MKKEENHFFIATDCKNDKVGKPSARGGAIPWEFQGKAEYSLLQKENFRKRINGSMQNVSLSVERG